MFARVNHFQETPENLDETERVAEDEMVPNTKASRDSSAHARNGLAHVFALQARMRPLVEAAGFPLAAVVSPVAVGIEIVAGLSLLLGLWARVGGTLAVPAMLGAIHAHLVIDVWPNGPANEPPLVLPIAVMVAAAYVAWHGAGRWSLDHPRSTRDDDARRAHATGLG